MGAKINPKYFSASQIKFYLILIPLAVFMIIPVIYVINQAFKPLGELFAFPPTIFVKNPTVKNFKDPSEQTMYEILGVELAIETTAPGDRFNECGFLLNTQTVLDSAKHAPPFQSVYHQIPDGTYFPPEGQKACHFEIRGNSPLFGVVCA